MLLAEAQAQLEAHSSVNKQLIWETFMQLQRKLTGLLGPPHSADAAQLKETVRKLSEQLDCMSQAKLENYELQAQVAELTRAQARLTEENSRLTQQILDKPKRLKHSLRVSSTRANSHQLSFRSKDSNRLRARASSKENCPEESKDPSKDYTAVVNDYAKLSKRYRRQMKTNFALKQELAAVRRDENAEVDHLKEQVRYMEGMYHQALRRLRELQDHLPHKLGSD